MRRRLTIVLSVVLLLLTMVAAVPASAAEAPVGTRVNIVAGTPTTLDADTPFYILHGWGVQPNLVQAIGATDFRLDVDGVDQGRGSLQNTGVGVAGAVVKLHLYNFHDGLPAGTYTFTGHWFLPCGPAVAQGLFPGPCDLPNEKVEVFTIPLTVTFS